MKRRIKFFFIPFIIFFVATGAILHHLNANLDQYLHPILTPPAWYGKLDESKPLKDQTVDIKIGTRTLRVPLMYIEGSVESSRQEESVLLEFFLPDFKATPEFKNKEEYKKAFNERRKSWLLIEVSEKRPSFEKMLEWHYKISAEKVIKKNDVYFLEKQEIYQKYKDKIILTNEFYIKKDKSGRITDFINCHVRVYEGVKRYPSCDHKFRDKEFIYDLSYNKENFLKNWEDVRERSINFVELMFLPNPNARE